LARCRRAERSALPVWILLWLLASVPGAGAAQPELRFSLHSKPLATRDLASLRRAHEPQTIRVFEPYEEQSVRFRAVDFREVLDEVYGPRWRAEEEILFTCRDGYQPAVPVERMLQFRPFLAFDREDAEGFSILKRESGKRRRVELGPFYLVWDNLEDEVLRRDGDYGWPYQLVGVDLIRARDRFPRMAPPEDAGPRVEAGFRHFRIHCSRCHAINGDGGSVGADLNQPVNPVEYRDREWLVRWIDDPTRIVPTARMPRLNPALPQRRQVIEEILDYLQAMSKARRADGPDPGGG
jgi:mono/diheme cytochrome c family protein